MANTPRDAFREAVASHYDGLDWFYRRVWGEHVHHGLWKTGAETASEAVNTLVRHVAVEARIGPGTRVCDVGCGYGATARLLACDHGAEVVGLTISPAQRAYAERAIIEAGCAERVTIDLEDWQENRLPAASFDAVVAIECVSHMADKHRFFEQVCRVLRPGGRAVVCAWLAADDPPAWQRKLLLEPIHRNGQLAAMLTEHGARKLVRDADLRLTRFHDLSRQVRTTWTCVLGRSLCVMLSDTEAWRRLRMLSREDRRFAIVPFWIWLAYRAQCMRYGMFVIESRTDSDTSRHHSAQDHGMNDQ